MVPSTPLAPQQKSQLTPRDQVSERDTLGDSELAAYLASVLTRLSEDAWDAAAFLDASPALEAGISALIKQLRGPADKIEPVTLPGDGYRHVGQWSFTDAAEALASDALAALGELTRPQRLTVADELAADAVERASAACVLAAGNDPESEHSRAWQMCEVTRTMRNGQTGPLPEGAAGWLVRAWGPDLGPAERWAARDRLARIEQLVATCKAHGGRASAQDDPLLAHLVLPRPRPQEDASPVVRAQVHARHKPAARQRYAGRASATASPASPVPHGRVPRRGAASPDDPAGYIRPGQEGTGSSRWTPGPGTTGTWQSAQAPCGAGRSWIPCLKSSLRSRPTGSPQGSPP